MYSLAEQMQVSHTANTFTPFCSRVQKMNHSVFLSSGNACSLRCSNIKTQFFFSPPSPNDVFVEFSKKKKKKKVPKWELLANNWELGSKVRLWIGFLADQNPSFLVCVGEPRIEH